VFQRWNRPGAGQLGRQQGLPVLGDMIPETGDEQDGRLQSLTRGVLRVVLEGKR
jgi:hypothetical protein